MKHGIQKKIAKATELSAPMISLILSGKKRPSWSTAKRLAAATGSDPVLWLEGTPNEIKQAIMEESDTLIKN
jgi:transcriptional regulator with XRE-family HTH domain